MPPPLPHTPKEPLHLLWVLLISLVLTGAGFVIYDTFYCTNPLAGFLNAVAQEFFFVLRPWGVFCVPWILIVWCIYRWLKLVRFRAIIMFLPALTLLGLPISTLVLEPPPTKRTFQVYAGCPLPGDAQDYRASISSHDLPDATHVFYFKTRPDEVERLIREMELVRDEYGGDYTPVPLYEGWPDYRDWTGLEIYKNVRGERYDFVYLVTDSTHTQVYILLVTI